MDVDASQSDVLDLGLETSMEVQADSTNNDGQSEHPRVTPRAREVVVPIPPQFENKTLAEIVDFKIKNGEMPDYNQMKAVLKRKFAMARKVRKQYLLQRKAPVQDLRKKLNVQRAKALVRAYGKAGPVVEKRIGRALRGELVPSVPLKRLKRFTLIGSGIKRISAKDRLGFKLPKVIPRGESGAPALILRETPTEEVEEYYEEEVPDEEGYHSNDHLGENVDANHNGLATIIPRNNETGAPALLLRSAVGENWNNPGYQSVQKPPHYSGVNGQARAPYESNSGYLPLRYESENVYKPSRYESENGYKPSRYEADSSYDPARYESEKFASQYQTPTASNYQTTQEQWRYQERVSDKNYYTTAQHKRNPLNGHASEFENANTPDLPEFCPRQPMRNAPSAASFIRRQTPAHFPARRQPTTPTTPAEEYVPQPIHPRDGTVDQVYVPTRTSGHTESDAKISAIHVFSTGIPLHQRISDYQAPIQGEVDVKLEPEYNGFIGAVY